MKYALLDGEIHLHNREQDMFLPLTLAEAQHVVDVMNRLTDLPGLGRPLLDDMKDGRDKLLAIAALVKDVQDNTSVEGT